MVKPKQKAKKKRQIFIQCLDIKKDEVAFLYNFNIILFKRGFLLKERQCKNKQDIFTFKETFI